MQLPLISVIICGMPIDMRIESKIPSKRTVPVMIMITPEMRDQLKAIAERVGTDVGVATVMRSIVEKALAEGITVTHQAQKGARPTNGRAAAED